MAKEHRDESGPEAATSAVATLGSYAVAKHDPAYIREVIGANVGKSLSEFDLDRVHVPAGGGKTWIIPGLSGEEEAKEVEGVIVAWREPRAYWRQSFDETGGGTPPDCSSHDGYLGVGDPGGECAICPMAQFGSAQRGRGQACRQMRLLFMLRPADLIPMVVIVPPTSLKAISSFFLRLAGKAIPFWGVTTRLALDKTRNKDGIEYSEIVVKAGSFLSSDEQARMRDYAKMLEPVFERVGVTEADARTGAAA